MKDFDLNNIGKEMPYKAPDKEFFDNFTEELLAKVAEEQPHKVFSLRGVLTPVIGIAAALVVILAVNFSGDDNKQQAEVLLSKSLNESLDTYFSSLSDEELLYLATDSSYQDDFYENLPIN